MANKNHSNIVSFDREYNHHDYEQQFDVLVQKINRYTADISTQSQLLEILKKKNELDKQNVDRTELIDKINSDRETFFKEQKLLQEELTNLKQRYDEVAAVQESPKLNNWVILSEGSSSEDENEMEHKCENEILGFSYEPPIFNHLYENSRILEKSTIFMAFPDNNHWVRTKYVIGKEGRNIKTFYQNDKVEITIVPGKDFLTRFQRLLNFEHYFEQFKWNSNFTIVRLESRSGTEVKCEVVEKIKRLITSHGPMVSPNFLKDLQYKAFFDSHRDTKYFYRSKHSISKFDTIMENGKITIPKVSKRKFDSTIKIIEKFIACPAQNTIKFITSTTTIRDRLYNFCKRNRLSIIVAGPKMKMLTIKKVNPDVL